MDGAPLAADIGSALTPSELGGVGGLESPVTAPPPSLYLPDHPNLGRHSATLTDSGGTTGRGRWRPAG